MSSVQVIPLGRTSQCLKTAAPSPFVPAASVVEFWTLGHHALVSPLKSTVARRNAQEQAKTIRELLMLKTKPITALMKVLQKNSDWEDLDSGTMAELLQSMQPFCVEAR